MPLERFQFENIDQIDEGSVALAVNQALRAAYHDCADRPEVKKPRKVSLEISLTPEMDRGHLSIVHVALDIKQGVPSKGIEVAMKPSGDGLGFQPLISDNPNQNPLPYKDND